MILITFINNFEVLIKIPSKNFFYEPFYKNYSFFILKYASFGVDAWVCLDGFETAYKLIHFYKKYVFLKNKSSMNFRTIIKFYFYSFYKIISFFFFFFIINYFNKYFIYSNTKGPLFEYYSNHIYNDKVDNHDLFLFLLPGYTFYYSYFSKRSIFEKTIISKFSLLIINEFYVFTLFVFIFYISNQLKSKIFDYLILIISTILYLLNYLICQFDEKNIYYSYKLVLDNFLTVRYPHIIFYYFFLGAMAGLTCYYYKDSFLNNSLINENENLPFNFCFSIINFFNYLAQSGRLFCLVVIFALQLIICFSFTFFTEYYQSIYIPFNTIQKIVLCYETGLFLALFCLIIIILFFIRNDNENKSANYSSLFILIERTNFTFFNCINLLLYTYNCMINFQLKLSFQNLWIITFGIFVVACFENLMLTLVFVFFFKVINKKVIKYLLNSEDNLERLSRPPSELMEKSMRTEGPGNDSL
jgi:hypothetical protein